MTTDNHEEGLRPSRAPALEKCIHNKPKEGEPSEAAGRGTLRHKEIAAVMQVGGDNLSPECQWACDLVRKYLKEGWKIVAVEQTVDILDEFGAKISQGTIDLVLERNREFLILDWKTGDKGDYDAQMYWYATGWWDLHPEAENVRALIAYVDLRETAHVYVSYPISSTNVLLLYDKWKNKEKEPYAISHFCDYCALRGQCPAWRKEAASALEEVNSLALHPKTGLPQGGGLASAAVDGLKNDPKRLDAFLVAWERAKTLVETDWNLKEALKTHMETGFKAEHHILVHVKDKIVKSVDSEQYLEKVAHQIGFANAAHAISVDPEKAVTAWRDFYGYGDDAKFPVEIKQTEVARPSYVRSKGKPGAGEARKKRKELE